MGFQFQKKTTTAKPSPKVTLRRSGLFVGLFLQTLVCLQFIKETQFATATKTRKEIATVATVATITTVATVAAATALPVFPTTPTLPATTCTKKIQKHPHQWGTTTTFGRTFQSQQQQPTPHGS
jgi:hypothetical protein